MTKLIVVDKNDKITAYKSWEECHALNGILHRAFSIFIFNKNGELLIQQRSKKKPLWPLFWSNTCCSHPRQEEKIIPTAEKRLKEEFGFTCSLKFIYKFYYQTRYKNIGSEHEWCSVLIGKFDGEPNPNKDEIANHKWVTIGWLKKDFKNNPDQYTPWFKKIIKDNKVWR